MEIGSFIPCTLSQFLEKQGGGSMTTLKCSSFFMNVYVLLVDISGFTKLSGSFCKKGKSGIDDLQKATNGYMGQLVKVIYDHGGDVVKFAGDAIIAIFPGDEKATEYLAGISTNTNTVVAGSDFEEEGISDSGMPNTGARVDNFAFQAVTCGLLLKDMVYESSLTVHVAVSCGEVCFGILGGFKKQYECLISGECIFEISQCLEDAPSGHCVVTKSVESSMGPESCSAICKRRLPSGNFEVFAEADNGREIVDQRAQFIHYAAVSTTSPEATRKFVPLPVLAFIEKDIFNYLAELRLVTTVFMKWDSYDSKVHRDLMSLQPAFLAVQTIISQAGGFIRQFLVDDKGCVLIACWGVPTCNHLDNAARAVSSAAKIHYKLEEMQMMSSFGITTGSAYCGCVGSRQRAEYAMIGDVINMAARLMCKAKGGIYIDAETRAFLKNNKSHSLKELDMIKVKGKEEPITVFEYDFEAEDQSGLKLSKDIDIYVRIENQKFFERELDRLVQPDQPFITLSKGLKRLSQLMTRSSNTSFSRNSTISRNILHSSIVEGSVGSGKSAMMKWLHTSAESRGVKVVHISLSQRDCLVQFGAVATLIRHFLGEDVFSDSSKQKGGVDDLLKAVYKGDQTKAEAVGLPILKLVLGVNNNKKLYEDLRDIESVSEKEDIQKRRPSPQLLEVKSSWVSRTLKSRPSRSLRLWSSPSLNIIYDGVEIQAAVSFLEELISRSASVLIIEHAHFADDASLQVLNTLQCAAQNAFMVLTASSSDSATISILETDEQSSLSRMRDNRIVDSAQFPWALRHRSRIISQENTKLVTLADYTEADMHNILLDRFPDISENTREQLGDVCMKISNGNAYWVLELIQYISQAGLQNFLNMIRSSETAAMRGAVASAKRTTSHISGTLSNSLVVAEKGSKTSSVASHLNVNSNRSNKSVDQAVPGIFHKNDYNHHQLAGLEIFIVCRYELLSRDEQVIIRTISIVGLNIDMVVISGIVPDKIAVSLSETLERLVLQNWLFLVRATGKANSFQFVHPLFRQVLYNLTPASERMRIHEAIAHFYMKSNEAGLTFKAAEVIAHHLSFCDEDASVHFQIEAASLALLDEAHAVDLCVELLSNNEFLAKLKDRQHLDRMQDVLSDSHNIIRTYIDMIKMHTEPSRSIRESSVTLLSSVSSWLSYFCPVMRGTIVPESPYSEEDIYDGNEESQSLALQNVYTIHALEILLQTVEGLFRVVRVKMRKTRPTLKSTTLMTPVNTSRTGSRRLLDRTRSHMQLQSRVTGDILAMFRENSASVGGAFFDTR